MKVLICGTGFEIQSAEEICLARGVEIVGYVDVDWESPEKDASLKEPRPLFSLCKRTFDLFGLPGDLATAKIGRILGISSWVACPIHRGYIYPERLRHRRIIPPSSVDKEDFDYIIIGHPAYEQFRKQFRKVGVPRRKILSLVLRPGRCLRILGKEKYLVRRLKEDGPAEPVRKYRTLNLEGKVTKDIPPIAPLSEQYPLVRTLIHSLSQAIDEAGNLSEPYRAGFNWNLVLTANRGKVDFWNLIKTQSVPEVAQLLNNCLRNELTASMFGSARGLLYMKLMPEKVTLDVIKSCYKAWEYSLFEDGRWEGLGLPPIGNPYGYRIQGEIIEANCFMNDYRSQLTTRLTEGIERPVVGEIGGGVGFFAYYLLRRNPNVVYINFDLPENLFISSYLLSMAYPDKRILYYDSTIKQLDTATLKHYDIILMPNFMLPKLASLSIDFFINTISLSEMDYEIISEYISQIDRTCKRYFYQENLADYCFSYKSYPMDFFPAPKSFREVYSSPSRWPFFSLNSKDHMYIERLYERYPNS